jgi:hypothetical protein
MIAFVGLDSGWKKSDLEQFLGDSQGLLENNKKFIVSSFF